jgi:tetratricopeptide (TPR) repeat protein
MLLLLDNARDAEQVRPLLPAGPAAMALVTSREQLPGLVAAGALPQVLDVLTADEARELLGYRLGPDAVAEPDDAVRRVVAACAGLPLALTIVAARATLSGFPLRALAAELADSRSRLDALDTGDPGRELRAVLGMSYSSLDPPAARLFRLFGLHPGSDVSAAAAASLGGLPPRRARSLLAALTRANLLAEPAPGRFAFHDLLRAYATDLTLATDPDQERQAAVDRMLDHYLHTALSACRLLNPHRNPPLVTAGPPRPGVHVEHLADRAEAQAWFDAERPALLAALRRSTGGADKRRTWLLAWTLDPHLYWRGHWEDHAGAWRTGIEAAERLGDHRLLAQSHRNLARALIRQGDYVAARDHLYRALAHSGLASDPAGEAGCHEQLAYLCERDGRFHDALDHARTAHRLFVAADHPRGQADALNSVGWYHALLDRHELALACCERAFALHEELGDLEGQAADLDSLGYAHRHLGHHRRATEVYRQAIALYERLGDQYNGAWSHRRLGDAHQAAGDLKAARSNWRHAYDLFTALDHPDADSVPHSGR